MSHGVIVTGASGYAGRLIAAALLAAGEKQLILPIRAERDPADVWEAIMVEARSLNPKISVQDCERRARFVPIEYLLARSGALAADGVREIVHSAGCVNYFDLEQLEKGNIELTRKLIDVGRRIDTTRLTFISTAFSCGDVGSAPIPEKLHPVDGRDMTEYTKSKRQAEWLIAQSGLPHVILRPSVLIGNSDDGRYCGKAYGLVQFWEGWSRLMCLRYRKELHLVVPEAPVPLLHQDDFQRAVLMSRTHLENGAIVNVVSPPDELVPTRDLYKMLLETVRPEKAYFYTSYGDVPRAEVDSAGRAFLDFCAVNIEISERDWRFQRQWMEHLEAHGLKRPRPTLESVKTCFEHFLGNSRRMQRYIERYKSLFSKDVQIVDRPGTTAGEPARFAASMGQMEEAEFGATA